MLGLLGRCLGGEPLSPTSGRWAPAQPIPPELLAPHMAPTENINLKKLKRFIKAGKLAPCHKGQEDQSDEVKHSRAAAVETPPQPTACSTDARCCRLLAMTHADGRVPHLLPQLPGPQHLQVLRPARLHRVLPAGPVLRAPARLPRLPVLQGGGLRRQGASRACARKALPRLDVCARAPSEGMQRMWSSRRSSLAVAAPVAGAVTRAMPEGCCSPRVCAYEQHGTALPRHSFQGQTVSSLKPCLWQRLQPALAALFPPLRGPSPSLADTAFLLASDAVSQRLASQLKGAKSEAQRRAEAAEQEQVHAALARAREVSALSRK